MVTAIQDPGAVAVQFGTSGATVTSRTDRRGTVVTFGYDAATRRLNQSVIDPTGLAIATGLTAAEGRGHGSGPTPVSSVAVSDAFTLLAGPRAGADDTRFWIDAYGAPAHIHDALGNQTTLRRGNVQFPALVTSVEQPNGYRDSVVHNARGNVQLQIRMNPFAASPAQHDTTRYVYYADTDVRADYAHTIVPPLRDSTVSSYLTDGQPEWRQDSRGPSSRTSFRYDAATRLLHAVQHPDGGVDSLAYDGARGNLAYHRSALGFVSTRFTDAVGRDTLVITPLDAAQQQTTTTRSTYNARGLLAQTRTDGPATTYSCDGCFGTDPVWGKPVTADYVTVDYLYSAEAEVEQVIRNGGPDPNVLTFSTQYSYDRARRRTMEVNDGRTQSFGYDPAGNQTSWTRFGRTITSEYDLANRLTRRILPEVFYAIATCDEFHGRNSPCITGLSFDSLRVRPDTQTFAYDGRGALVAAHNRYARVTRSYYPGGELHTDTIRFRLYGTPDLSDGSGGGGGGGGDPCPPVCPEFVESSFGIMSGGGGSSALPGDPYPDSDYASHIYGLRYTYDRNGRRASLTYPAGLPPASFQTVTYSYHPWGALQAVDGLLGPSADRFSYDYDASGRVTSVSDPSGVVESLLYDLDSRLIRRTQTGLYDDTLGYDARGKITLALLRASNLQAEQWYSALGYIVASRWTQLSGNGLSIDEYRYDPYGNPTWSKKRDSFETYASRLHTYDSFGLLQQIDYNVQAPEEPNGPASFRDFDPASGDLLFGTEVYYYANSTTERVAPSRYYYAADGKLRAIKKYDRTWDGTSTLASADLIQEIRYDALGRRITQHTRHKPSCSGFHCTAALERSIWDGDQLVYELRTDGSGSLESQWGSSRQHGRTGYVHGPGIDAPLAVYRSDFASSSAIRILPRANWRGAYEKGHFSGGWPECNGSNGPSCVNMDWPAEKLRVYFDGPNPQADWVGSLIQSQRDASGLLYRRNRYYDPNTGQFIQEDPIGLAGGLNLYGYAGGDPVNFSDPFGLCKVDVRFSKVGFGYHAYIVTAPNDATTVRGPQFFRAGPTRQVSTGPLRMSGASGGASSQSSGSNSNSGNSSSPGSGPGGKDAGGWGPLQSTRGDYVPGTVDYPRPGEQHPSMNVVDDDVDCAVYEKSFEATLDAIDAAAIPYNPFRSNSNAVVRTMLSRAGINAGKPIVRAPGFGVILLR